MANKISYNQVSVYSAPTASVDTGEVQITVNSVAGHIRDVLVSAQYAAVSDGIPYIKRQYYVTSNLEAMCLLWLVNEPIEASEDDLPSQEMIQVSAFMRDKASKLLELLREDGVPL
jgi:hypothetical protein